MTQHIRKPRRSGVDSQIRIPHSSWTHADRKRQSVAPVKAEEFWSRLGL